MTTPTGDHHAISSYGYDAVVTQTGVLRALTFEGRDPDDVRAKCRKWKEADISTQGFIMRLAIDGGRVRTDMLNTAEACDAVADAATPLY